MSDTTDVYHRQTALTGLASKRDGLDDIVGISDADFRAAIANVPAGWVDGRTDADHLAELRTTVPVVCEFFDTIDDEPTEGGALAALLGDTR